MFNFFFSIDIDYIFDYTFCNFFKFGNIWTTNVFFDYNLLQVIKVPLVHKLQQVVYLSPELFLIIFRFNFIKKLYFNHS